MKGCTALVTGAKGFQATHLAHRLTEHGVRVVGIARHPEPHAASGVRIEVGSVEDAGFVSYVMRRHEPEFVFHLAAWTEVGKSAQYPHAALSANVTGTTNVLEAARLNRKLRGLVFVSSDKAYGPGPIPYVESQPFVLNSADTYSFSKALADLTAQHYACRYGLPLRIARPANIYGPGQRNKTTLITATINRLMNGQPPSVRAGRENVLREWVYVDDAIEAYIRLAEDAAQGDDGLPPRDEPGALAFNIGSGDICCTKSMIEEIVDIYGYDGAIETDPPIAAPETGDQYVKREKFRQRFHWQYTGLRLGLRRTVEWCREDGL